MVIEVTWFVCLIPCIYYMNSGYANISYANKKRPPLEIEVCLFQVTKPDKPRQLVGFSLPDRVAYFANDQSLWSGLILLDRPTRSS